MEHDTFGDLDSGIGSKIRCERPGFVKLKADYL